jgi:uncharacterized membrane protein YadS
MRFTSILVGLALGICTFALAWATVRHFTGLAHEHDQALVIAIVVGLMVGLGYVIIESNLFDTWLRHKKR